MQILTPYLILLALILMNACGKPIPGPQGAPGSPGESIVGPKGDTGEKGQDGTPGADAASVSIVTFCPGFAKTSFPETGICVGGVIQAVYWDGHNAWLTEVPPGLYASTSTGAACSFVVLEDCQVSQQ